MPKSLVNKTIVFSLLCSLLVMTTACGGESSSDTNSSQVNQTTEIRNGEVKLNCSSSSPDDQVTTTATVNGKQYKCENGRTIRVR
ncbi:hypothetical protein [Brasilonema sp. UFV-L1]|uniref:hypothetical protein n=1 Tax=Brasilonema sp. UFV-L1 TaxID=2234130 RepID=UPI00145CB8CF|nr:hypothetical protein [Brasilonema sp. UFV-L1]NMG11827.1 hypothetical protein [Brasilonema sp. UFV-L1]